MFTVENSTCLRSTTFSFFLSSPMTQQPPKIFDSFIISQAFGKYNLLSANFILTMCQSRHTSLSAIFILPTSYSGNSSSSFAHSYLPSSLSRLKYKPLPKARIITSETDFLYVFIEVLTIHPAIACCPFVVDEASFRINR